MTAFLAALVATLASMLPPFLLTSALAHRATETPVWICETILLGAFALFALDLYRTRRREMLPSLLIFWPGLARKRLPTASSCSLLAGVLDRLCVDSDRHLSRNSATHGRCPCGLAVAGPGPGRLASVPLLANLRPHFACLQNAAGRIVGRGKRRIGLGLSKNSTLEPSTCIYLSQRPGPDRNLPIYPEAGLSPLAGMGCPLDVAFPDGSIHCGPAHF